MQGFPGGAVVKNLPTIAGDAKDLGWILGSRDCLEEERQPTPVFLPGEFNGLRSLVGYSPWTCKDMTEQLNMHAWHKDFPAGPVVKTLSFQCRGRGPLVGELRSCAVGTKIIEKNYEGMASLLHRSSALHRHFPLHASFPVLSCVMRNCLLVKYSDKKASPGRARRIKEE